MKASFLLCLALVMRMGFCAVAHAQAYGFHVNDPDHDWAKARVTTIAFQLYQSLHKYHGMNQGLVPSDPFAPPYYPGIAEIKIDSSVIQDARELFYIRISAWHTNPPPPPPQPQWILELKPPQRPNSRHNEDAVPARIGAPEDKLLHETLPGTDVAIEVVAASPDEPFMANLRAALAKLPPVPASLKQAAQQRDAIRKQVVDLLAGELESPKGDFYVGQYLIGLQAETPVIDALTNQNRAVQIKALYALKNESVSAAAVPPLISLLKTDDYKLRARAMEALATIQKQKELATSALMPFLQDTNPYIQYCALKALVAFRLPANVLLPKYLQLLSNTHAYIRSYTVPVAEDWVLTNDKAGVIVPAMVRMAHDPDTNVRVSAIWAMEKILNQKLFGGESPYLHLPRKPLGQFAPLAETMTAAITDSLSDPNTTVRAQAARALVQIGRGKS